MQIADDIEMGESVTRAFKRHEIFAGIVLQMVAAGEEAGRLDELLLSAANYFDSLLMQRIGMVTALINPALTAFVGLSTAGLMVAAFLPVFDMPGPCSEGRRSAVAITDAWARSRVRFARKPEKAEEPGALRLSVSETGGRRRWSCRTSRLKPPPNSWTDANVPITAVEAIRRAVRSISRAQRERIGSVRLAVADPAILLIDGRSARISSTDPAVIAQLGCQELGVDAVLFAFAPFGQSSEYEVARGAYAFIAVEQVKEYLIALDNLATQLVELVPAPLLELADAEAGAIAGFQLRNSAATLLLADPETGTVLCRQLEFGRSDCVAAVANATSVSPREAAEGLQRRICFQAEAGWAGAPMPMTATERALTSCSGR